MIIKSTSISIRMIKNIIVQPSDNTLFITEYFDFNSIPYYIKELWSNDGDEFGGYRIPPDLLSSGDHLLILNYSVFQEFFNWHVSAEEIVKFSKNNHIWVWNDIDGLVSISQPITLINQHKNLIREHITLFSDGVMLFDSTGLNVQEFPVNAFLKMPRIKFRSVKKSNCNYDFLLTTVVKPDRPHRHILLNDLSTRPIYSKGLISQNTLENKFTNWLGDSPHQHCWCDGYPSMDLYSQCWFEIVPETMYQNGYFYTEKTNKPIATKAPFLTVSTKGYLEYLRSLGFKTFDSLINESYDQQDAIEDRVRLMLDQAEDIIANGSEQFYHAAMPILEHNYNHLAELSGKWDHLMDAFITQQLERVSFKI